MFRSTWKPSSGS